MKILYYDCFAGISGDMNLASMIDLGVDAGFLQKELSKLGLDDEFELQVRKDSKMGIGGTKVTANLKTPGQQEHPHAHLHHSHRNLNDIKKIIDGSDLGPAVKKTAIDIFGTLARAEAKVHGEKIEEIHFHEVGATDAIVDIVGAAICYHKLDVDHVFARPVELGGGFVKCMHGIMPVPAPATVQILKACPVTLGAVQSETTTPTGAAILRTLVHNFAPPRELKISKIGYGIGHRDTELPNILRVFMGETEK